jgi:hypothetical protein
MLRTHPGCGCPPRFLASRRWTLGRPNEFAVEPAAHFGFDRVARHNRGVNATALLALEYAIIETNWSRLNFRENHAGLVVLRATLPDSEEIG